MNQRKVYPYEVYIRPGSISYDTKEGNGNFVFVELRSEMTIIQYPRPWQLSQCARWAEQNDFPVPEFFGGTPKGCLMFGPWEH